VVGAVSDRADDLGGVARHHLSDLCRIEPIWSRLQRNQIPEVLDVQVWRHRAQHHHRLLAGIGKRMRGAAWRRDERARLGADRLAAAGESRRARDDEERLVMLAVDVLRRSVDARRNGDFEQAESVVGVLAILEDAQPHRASLDEFALGAIDNLDRHAFCSLWRHITPHATSVAYYEGMPGSRQAPDRSNQRARTRAAILNAAVAMLRQGRQPTVAEAAEAAGVHRATAHRYFPTPQSLLADATLAVNDPRPADVYRGVSADDPVALMDAGVRAVSDYMFREEALFRSIVQVTIEGWFAQQAARGMRREPVRETRRFGWIDRALAPVAASLPAASLRRLRCALALVFGAEALIVTRDVARLDPGEATEVMRWAAATLIRGALAQVAPDAPSPVAGRRSKSRTAPPHRAPAQVDSAPPRTTTRGHQSTTGVPRRS
jgi:hypothetical protein